jgi:L-2-hydroxyglutarate oxidase
VRDELKVDVCVIGAGLVGLSVAYALARSVDGVSIAVVDKEDRIASHQSGNNSGVVHSGLYYRPGSLKARLCVEGRRALYELADSADVAIRRTGKLVIATSDGELPVLDELERRGTANGLLGLERVGPSGVRAREPNAVGVEALWVPEAGIVDYSAVARHLAGLVERRGGVVLTGRRVTTLDHGVSRVSVGLDEGTIDAAVVVNCSGLQADRVAQLAGIRPSIRIVPFRGEYYRMVEPAAGMVRGLIYPVPDPRFPFLGVHFTRRVDGVVEVGPNAVLALAREQYRGRGPDWRDMLEVFGYSGFWKLAARHWRAGMVEIVRSRSARLYARAARRLVPDVEHGHLVEGGVGVRAQAVARDGTLVDDFVIETSGATIHVLNAPSPGATASIAIGEHIAIRVREIFSG